MRPSFVDFEMTDSTKDLRDLGGSAILAAQDDITSSRARSDQDPSLGEGPTSSSDDGQESSTNTTFDLAHPSRLLPLRRDLARDLSPGTGQYGRLCSPEEPQYTSLDRAVSEADILPVPLGANHDDVSPIFEVDDTGTESSFEEILSESIPEEKEIPMYAPVARPRVVAKPPDQHLGNERKRGRITLKSTPSLPVRSQPDVFLQDTVALERKQDDASADLAMVRRTRNKLKKAQDEERKIHRALFQRLQPPPHVFSDTHTVAWRDIEPFVRQALDRRKRVFDLEDLLADVETRFEDAHVDLQISQRRYTQQYVHVTDNKVAPPRLEPVPGYTSSVSTASSSSGVHYEFPQHFLLGISGDRPDDIHPTYAKLMSAVGRLKMTLEEQGDRWAELQRAVEDKQVLLFIENHGRDLTKKQQRNLAEYSQLEDTYEEVDNTLQRQIDNTTADIQRLKAICVASGAIPLQRTLDEMRSIGDGLEDDDLSISGDVDLNPQAADFTARSLFPILLSNPTHHVLDFPKTSKDALKDAISLPISDPTRQQNVDAAFKEYELDHIFELAGKNGSKADMINRWLFHRLRISPHEVELLWTIACMVLGPLNHKIWQQSVLYCWGKDTTAHLPNEAFEGILTSVLDSSALQASVQISPGSLATLLR